MRCWRVRGMLLVLFAGSQVCQAEDPLAQSAVQVLPAGTADGESGLQLREQHNPDGTLVLISNRSTQRLWITNSHGLSQSLAGDASISWPCTASSPPAHVEIVTADGVPLGSMDMLCGDAVFVKQGN